MALPATLEERIAIYSENARVYRHDKEIFGEFSWFAVMHGQGLRPRSFHPLADMMSAELLDSRLRDIRRAWQASLDSMPSHQSYIDTNCKAEPVAA